MPIRLNELNVHLMGSFIFCTSFFNSEAQYRERYLRWIDYYSGIELSKDKPLVIIDDGSPDLSFVGSEASVWKVEAGFPDQLDKVNIFTFPNNLGRVSHLGYWGWWRSFLFSFEIAKNYNLEKIIHIESDCFLLTEKATSALENFKDGWMSFWTDKYRFPETNIQVITKSEFSHLDNLEEMVRREKRKTFGSTIHAEHLLPFTKVDKDMVGDRYGEENLPLSSGMDYYCQTPPEIRVTPEDFNQL